MTMATCVSIVFWLSIYLTAVFRVCFYNAYNLLENIALNGNLSIET